MTIKEAILKSLEGLIQPSNNQEVFDYMMKNNFYNFKNAKTPKSTISALLGDFIRKDDSRVKRTKGKSSVYFYYLAKNEELIKSNFSFMKEKELIKEQNSYKERDLHKLLSSYLKHKNIYSKTILHEESKNSKDEHQKWIHPDMIGIEFIQLTSDVTKVFMKILNKADTFKFTSYEIKKEINTDYELKKSYFQAVSNSSWANYGYLVAFEIADSLKDEMERLNQSFGIGIIELKTNPYESKILFQAKYRELDFRTIDKLCKVNKKYEKFIELTERILSIEERNYNSIENELIYFSDSYFQTDSEIRAYCKSCHIPYDEE